MNWAYVGWFALGWLSAWALSVLVIVLRFRALRRKMTRGLVFDEPRRHEQFRSPGLVFEPSRDDVEKPIRACKWCDYTGHPLSVLQHEITEHKA